MSPGIDPNILSLAGMVVGNNYDNVAPSKVIEPEFGTDAKDFNEYLSSDIFCYKLERKPKYSHQRHLLIENDDTLHTAAKEVSNSDNEIKLDKINGLKGTNF